MNRPERLPETSTTSPTVRPDVVWRIASGLLLVTLGAIAAATFLHYGTTWDEEYHLIYGDGVLAWYRSLFRDRAAIEFGDLYLYGGLFDAVAQLASRVLPFGAYESRHLVNAAFGLAGIAATWRLGALLGGPRAGFLAALALALTPAWWGHSFANPKDIPFAALHAVALASIIASARAVPRVRWRAALMVGLAAGAAMGVRVGAVLLLGWLGLAWAGAWWLRTAPAERARALPGVALRLAVAAATAWGTMLLFWPWAQEAPFSRPLEALRAATRFHLVYPVLFEGRTWQSNALPWTYVPTWFGVTLPEFYLVALAAGLAQIGAVALRRASLASDRLLELGVVCAAAVVPPVIAIALRANLYDAQRHFLFVLPPLAALAGAALSGFLASGLPRWTRAALATVALACGVITAREMVRLHPYEYVYFNRLVGGGLAGAKGRFETDYWGASYREGAEWLLRHYTPPATRRVRVANCGPPFLTRYWLERDPAGGRFRAVEWEQDPDVYLATTRWHCSEDIPGRLLHTVEREGTPLLYVFELHPPDGT